MKTLLAEDDFVTRKFMEKMLEKYGECDVVVDGNGAIDAFMIALDGNEVYDLICLDVMMPEMDGYQVLKGIRNIEKAHRISKEQGVKIIMITALNEQQSIDMAFELGCSVYCAKPIDIEKFEEALRDLKLI